MDEQIEKRTVKLKETAAIVHEVTDPANESADAANAKSDKFVPAGKLQSPINASNDPSCTRSSHRVSMRRYIMAGLLGSFIAIIPSITVPVLGEFYWSASYVGLDTSIQFKDIALFPIIDDDRRYRAGLALGAKGRVLLWEKSLVDYGPQAALTGAAIGIAILRSNVWIRRGMRRTWVRALIYIIAFVGYLLSIGLVGLSIIACSAPESQLETVLVLMAAAILIVFLWLSGLSACMLLESE